MKKFTKLACAVAIASGANAASASLLSQLYFSQAAGWVDPVVSEGVPGTPTFSGGTAAGAPAGTFTTLSWTGTNNPVSTNPGNDPSSIMLTSYTSDNTTIRLDSVGDPDATAMEWNEGDVWAIDQLLQTNNVLSGGTFSEPTWVANTLANFRVFDDMVGGNEVLADLNSEVEVTFVESVNGSCVNYASPLFDGGAPPCDDIYTVNLADFAPLEFTQGGFVYSIGFTLINGVTRDSDDNIVGSTLICGFPGIDDIRCDAPGVTPPPGQAAVYTPEFAPGTTDLYVAAFWTSREVPAPGLLGLMGIGLAALGFSKRRAKA